MKNWKKGILAGLVIVMAVPVWAANRVAQLSHVNGTVTVARSVDGAVDQATQRGNRVINGSLFSGDVVKTDADAGATLVFTDGTKIKLKAGTRLSVVETDLSAEVAAGRATKPIGRTVKLFVGDIWTHVAHNQQVMTEFQTPSGVAAVKGTTFTISVGPGDEEEVAEAESSEASAQ